MLRRTLHALPDFLLSKLADGLEHYGDEMVSGRLYRSSRGGGCPVGVLLLERDPDLVGMGRVRFWLRHRWRRTSASYQELAEHWTRLTHLEHLFDDAVNRTLRANRKLDVRAAAGLVGRWFLAETKRELRRRRERQVTADPGTPPNMPASHPALEGAR